MLILMTNNNIINGFLRKRFRAKEVYTVQMIIDLLKDYSVQAVVLSEFVGEEGSIIAAVSAIRQASPVKIIYIAREVSEEAGRALFGAGVMIVEGEFQEELLVSLVEQYYDTDAVKRFALSDLTEEAAAGLPTFVRQRVIAFVGGPGSGKSVITNSLARVIAKSGARTLLVDLGDYPMQHIYFDMKGKYRERNIDLYAINMQSKLKNHLVEIGMNLYVLPGAQTNLGEIKITAQRMKDLLREAKEQFDVLIFDCSHHINEISTDEAVKAANDVFMVTTADNGGRTHAIRLSEYLPDNFFWVENRYIETTPQDLYMKFKHKMSPVFRFPIVDSLVSLQQTLDKGQAHPVMLDYAGRFTEKVLGLKPAKSRNKWFSSRRKEDAKTTAL